MKISVIIPVYNEENFILKTLEKVNEQKKNFELEIIVVDDKSKDRTVEKIKNNYALYDLLIENDINQGKGAAIKKGLDKASGDAILIQDADFEYDPDDYSKLILAFKNFNADVVLVSRFKGSQPKKIIYYSHQVANKILTMICNILTNRNFSDIETGYKLIRRSTLKEINISRNDFGIEIELIMKLAKIKCKIFEVGISYNGRSYDEGKKIQFKDFLIAIYLLFKYFLNLK
jgi:glycosyltransferase involved in cell wall biosynthesis